MNRIGKKCFFASIGLHVLLLSVLLFGMAFHSSVRPPTEQMNRVTIIHMLTDKPSTSAGGAPEARPPEAPAVQPVAPTPAAVVDPKPEIKPEPKPEAKTEPKVEPPKPEVVVKPPPEKAVKKPADKVKPPRTKPDVTPHRHPAADQPKPVETPSKPSVKPVKEEKVTKPQNTLDDAELTPVHRAPHTRPPKPVKEVAAGPDPAVVEAQERSRVIRELASTIGHAPTAASSIVKLDSSPSAGEDTAAQTNYRDLVFSKYNAAWQPSSELDDDKATVFATITIAPNGRVIGSEISQRSGNRLMDNSIQAVLNRVTFIEPFPAGTDNRPRTYMLRFNLQTKRAIG